MAKIYVGMERVPSMPNAGAMFMLGVQDIYSMMRIVGAEIRSGIRHYSPRQSWQLYRKCKVVSWRATVWTARVRVGWVRSDFPRGKFYPVWVGEGTGVFARDHARRIYPKKNVRVPMIRYQYSGKWVSQKSIRGQKPQNLLDRGYERAIPMILSLMSRTMFTSMRTYKHA